MSKVIGFDYGSKRTGVAISDDLRMIASPMHTIHSSEIKDFLKKQIEENNVDEVVLGLPVGLKGEETNSTKQVEDLVKNLKKTFPEISVHTVDERFTSKLAGMAMIEGNVPKKKRREKGMIDKVSAAIILQSFLDQSSK